MKIEKRNKKETFNAITKEKSKRNIKENTNDDNNNAHGEGKIIKSRKRNNATSTGH